MKGGNDAPMPDCCSNSSARWSGICRSATPVPIPLGLSEALVKDHT
jgi:hypothetical protein